MEWLRPIEVVKDYFRHYGEVKPQEKEEIKTLPDKNVNLMAEWSSEVPRELYFWTRIPLGLVGASGLALVITSRNPELLVIPLGTFLLAKEERHRRFEERIFTTALG